MPSYTQDHRPLAITTPLGKDVLLLTGFRGNEAISQPFCFQLDLVAETKAEIRFDGILGQSVTVEMRLPDEEKRHLNGLVRRFSQGSRDDAFVHFRAELVPRLWLLTKRVRSRIFQHLSVPDILRRVLTGLDVTYDISGTYHRRDYCVQYRESDFDFASRLMEDEGIHYFFKHSAASHQMVVTDVVSQHPSVLGQNNVIYEQMSGGATKDMRITSWEKSQELRSGEYTLWDHCFELPDKHLEAKKKSIESVAVGEVTHSLHVGGNDQLEIYDYPGGYAQRFDGIDRNGAARPQDLQGIYLDSERTVGIRMEQEAAVSVEIRGASNCGHFVAGHQFTLARHFDANGRYLLTRVDHAAHLDGNYRSNQALPFHYENNFVCTPVALPYRPQRVTRKPVIAGIQTATVVGPPSEEIFCDKYGRVKVQFHWDRDGKKDADSSCWLRVAQAWAGKGWGSFFWPRVGHEVVVVFEEGDPDQPLIIGSVYNSENMPPFPLPNNRQLGGLKSASVRGTANRNFNGIVFNDEKGSEHLSVHSERNMSLNSEYDKMFHAGRHKGERVSSACVLTVGNLPGGGGSGGGFDKGDTNPNPPPLGIGGLNSVMVFGENLQVATGLNHQLAIGNNLQICINPAGLLAGIPTMPAAPTLTGFFGSGLGGNMQLTLGTSASFVMGQTFDFILGPTKIELHANYTDHPVTLVLCGSLGAAAAVYALAYGLSKEDNTRATLALVFQALVDVLLAALYQSEMLEKKKEDKLGETLLGPLFRASPGSASYDEGDALGSFGVSAVLMASMVAPIAKSASEF